MSSNLPPGVTQQMLDHRTYTDRRPAQCRFCKDEILIRFDEPNICDGCAEHAAPDRDTEECQ